MMDEKTNAKVQMRLRKVAGQVEGIRKMVDANRYCVDILHQVAAVQSALGQVAKIVLKAHVETCVASALSSSKKMERDRKIDELMEVIFRHGGGLS